MVLPTSLPVLTYADLCSVDPQRRRPAVQTLGQALETVGFFILDGAPIAPEVVHRAYQSAQRFFALPEMCKRQYALPPGTEDLGGFSHFGSEQAKGHPCPDLKEFWHVTAASLHHPQAPWPQEVPPFRAVMTRLYDQLDACAGVLLEACALYLDQPADWLRTMAQGGKTVMRLAHYPPLPVPVPVGSLRAAPHEDINLITLLCRATQPGLEILTRQGEWLPVQAGPHQLVVDTGDMLQNLTNGLFRSTTHRVVNPVQDPSARLAIPFFVHPRPEVDLSPYPPLVARTGGQPSFAPLTAGEYLHQRLQEIQVP